MICTTLRAVMICQAYGNPQSSASSLRGTPTAAWIKKFREQSSRNFLAEKERFELSRRYSRPTPLAGAPLRPLEYFSVYSSRSAVCIRPATSILYTVFACLSSLFGKFFSLFGFCQPFFCMIFNCAIDILPFMRYNIIGLIDFTQRAPKYKKEE